jgi:hypothetical protein
MEGDQVMRLCVSVVVIGATLRNDEWVMECCTGVGFDGYDGADSGAGSEVNCGGGGEGVTLGSGAGAGMLSGREVCWWKMLLSWSSLQRWLSEMGDRGEDGEGDNNAWARS